MAVLEILVYPDERLRAECDAVVDFDDPDFQGFLDDLIETMEAAPGCTGIAAPQAGRAIQVVVVDPGLARKPQEGHHGRQVLVNPEILSWDGMEMAREGCLSLPDYTGNVVRAKSIRIQFQDRYGKPQTFSAEDFEARLYQHEMDHLEGRLFIDRVVSRKSDLFSRKSYGKSKKKKGA